MALLVVLILISKNSGFSFGSPMRIPFVLFILWSFLSLFVALDKVASANDFFAHLIKLVLLYYMLINYYNTKKKLEILSWLIIISGTIFAVAILFHWYVILGSSLTARLGLTYKNYATSINGFLTVFALVLSIRQFPFEKKPALKWFLALSIVSLSAASILSQGRATAIALLVAVCIINARKVKTVVITCILIVLFVMVMPIKSRFTSVDHYKNRIGQFLYTYEIIKDHPVFGIGYSVDTFRDDSRIDRAKYMARLPDKYQQQKYGCLMHGVGLCDEWPLVSHPEKYVEGAFDYELQPGMVLCVEALVSEVGGDFSIKLEDQVLVTETGYENLTTYPFDERLMGTA
jgi:hypothetical protein